MRLRVLAVCSGRQVENHVGGPACMRSVPCGVSKSVCVCWVFAAAKMWRLESKFSGERLAQYRRLESAPGPQYQLRVMEDRAATMDESLPAKGREEVKVGPDVTSRLFEGIELPITEEPPVAALPDYPSAAGDRFRAAAESGRLAALGTFHWYSEGSYPPDLRACPSHWVEKGDKVRVARDCPNELYPLNSVLDNPPVQYGAMGDFLRLLASGALVGGVDLQDWFLRWLAAPSRRRYLGVRYPASGI